MKKILISILSVILALSLLFVSSASVYAEEAGDNAVKTYARGDVDKDGEITAADARTILRISVKLHTPVGIENQLADVDANGAVTAADARFALRYSVFNVKTPIDKILYDTAHPLLGKHKAAFDNPIMKNFQKWCCFYTLHDVFRPALKAAGYSDSDIDLLAPVKYPEATLKKFFANHNIIIPPFFVTEFEIYYVPSLLGNYYLNNPNAAETFIFCDYFDDEVDNKIIQKNVNSKDYVPRVGDILFISNKLKTYEGDYPTIDHTAQIIKTYADGSFLCTEGSIVESQEGDGLARVRERRYKFNKEEGTYSWIGNGKLICLMAARPNI